jgi:tetratricopeptide (TPR) repeat protein
MSMRAPLLLIALTTATPAVAAPATSPAAPATPPAAASPATGPAETNESKAEALFRQGTDALYQGKYDAAIAALEQAVALDKAKSGYRMHLARAFRYAGRNAEAERLLGEILKQTPDHVEAGQILGEIHARAGDWKRVVGTLEPLLTYRHDYTTYHLLAEAKFNLGDLDGARRHYEEAVKLNPRSGSDHYQLGNIYLSGNFFALAAEAYQRSLGLGLRSPVLHYKLGSAYFNLRNYFGRTAEVTVKSGKPETIQQDWFLIEPVRGRPDVWRAAPAESAVYQVAKAVAEGLEDRPDIRFLMANIYLNAGRFDRAHALFGQLERAIPREDKALFYYYFAQSAFGTGKYDDYLAHLQRAIELDPAAYQATLVDAFTKVAEQHNQAGDLTRYIEFLNKAVGQSPQSASLHLQLGNAYEEAQQFDRAVTQWKMVLDLEPEHPKRIELVNLVGKYGPSGQTPAAGPETKPAGPATQRGSPETQPAGDRL